MNALDQKTKRGNYRLPLAIALVVAFVLGGGACAIFLGVTIGHPEFAQVGVRLPFISLLDPWRPLALITLAYTTVLLATIVIPFVRREWSRMAYVAVGLVFLYWIACSVLMMCASRL